MIRPSPAWRGIEGDDAAHAACGEVVVAACDEP
jgi:hypothetical protein